MGIYTVGNERPTQYLMVAPTVVQRQKLHPHPDFAAATESAGPVPSLSPLPGLHSGSYTDIII